MPRGFWRTDRFREHKGPRGLRPLPGCSYSRQAVNEVAEAEAIADFERALLAPGEERLPTELLRLGPAAGAAERALNGVVNRATTYVNLSAATGPRFKDVGALYGDAVRFGSPCFVVEALNYLRLYDALGPVLGGLDVMGRSWFGAALPDEETGRLTAAVEATPGFDPGLMSSGLMLGKLEALRDRTEAARAFARALAVREEMGPLRFNRGAHTYFDVARLERDREAVAGRRRALQAPQPRGPEGREGRGPVILVAAEREYLRTHLPYWLSVAEQLGDIGWRLHVLAIGGEAEAAVLIEKARVTERALARFRGRSAPRSGVVSFSSVPVPPWCAHVPAFAACAPLLHGREIAERHGAPVVAVDVDMRITDDPRPWLEALPAEAIGLDDNRIDVTIDPWRKFRGGVYVLPQEEAGLQPARLVEDYLLSALAEPDPWFADQNALDFLHETAAAEREAHRRLYPLKRLPMRSPFRGTMVDYVFLDLARKRG